MKIIVKTNVLIYCALLGVVLLGSGLMLGFQVFPFFVEKKIWEKSVLKENTTQWEMFLKIPFPFQFKVYFFNVENPEQILQGAKPRVKEIGPYIYKLHKWKEDVEIEKDEITFYEYNLFEFDKEASGHLNDDDEVTILNVAFNSLILSMEEMMPSALESLDGSLGAILKNNDQLFMRTKVKDFLFGGMKICENGGAGDAVAELICPQMKLQVNMTKAMWIEKNTIYSATMHYKNNTHLGRLTINSGLGVREKLNDLVRYNNRTRLVNWLEDGGKCNEIRGTTTFHPYVTPAMKFSTFGEDICMILTMSFEKDEEIKGIKGHKYVPLNDSFNSPLNNPENSCYCVNRTRNLDGSLGCLGDGLVDMKSCVGAPIVISFPHLLYVDEEYKRTVDGCRPNKDLHENFVILEPLTGTPLKAAKRLQFNMFIRAVDDIISIENVTNALVPIFWVEESLVLNDKYTNMLKNDLLSKLNILEIIKWTMIGTGLFITNFSLFLLVVKKQL